MHCHMTHHVMNQMGHEGPNMIGVDATKLQKSVRQVVPGFIAMGTNGMGDMSSMSSMEKMDMPMNMPGMGNMSSMKGHGGSGSKMPMPENSIAMMGGPGPYGMIDMGGMLTIFKVRENLTSYSDPGPYQAPPGTVAHLASKEDLDRDGIRS